MKRIRLIAIVLAVLLVMGVVTVYATQGDQSDPLITLSYLEQVVTPKLNEAVDSAVTRNAEELARQLDIAITSYENRVDEKLAGAGGSAFVSKDLSRGESLTLSAGHEILLVSGSAVAVGDLVDSTGGMTVKSGGALTAGHLYITTSDRTGLQATAAVRVMSR